MAVNIEAGTGDDAFLVLEGHLVCSLFDDGVECILSSPALADEAWVPDGIEAAVELNSVCSGGEGKGIEDVLFVVVGGCWHNFED